MSRIGMYTVCKRKENQITGQSCSGEWRKIGMSEKEYYEDFAKRWKATCLAAKKKFEKKLKDIKIVAYDSEGNKVK